MSDRFYFFKGRVALYAILKAMGIGPGDEIILPGFTCVVVPNAIMYLGAKPVYVDIQRETYNIDPQRIEEKITKRTRAIIVQHTFGIPVDMEDIIGIARTHNLYVIEDACHAIGSTFKGQNVGTFGDAAFFSSQWSKPITTGIGGWAVLNNEELQRNMEKIYWEYESPSLQESILLRFQYIFYKILMRPSSFWLLQKTYRALYNRGLLVGSSSPTELSCTMPDHFRKRMASWQMILLKKKLVKVHMIIAHRKNVVQYYENELLKMGLDTVKPPKQSQPVYLRYPILVKNKGKMLEEAEKKRVEIGDWFISPVHNKLTHFEEVGYHKGMCPVAENACRRVINLPTHEKINEVEQKKIISFIREMEVKSR